MKDEVHWWRIMISFHIFCIHEIDRYFQGIHLMNLYVDIPDRKLGCVGGFQLLIVKRVVVILLLSLSDRNQQEQECIVCFLIHFLKITVISLSIRIEVSNPDSTGIPDNPFGNCFPQTFTYLSIFSF